MGVMNELDTQPGTSSKIRRRSYFALIPIFNRKEKKHHTERNIIKIIRKSDFCKSHPILKTLLIENVRICCVVVESSGKRSIKVLCASAPYIFALISKANPKFEKLLKSEKVLSYLNVIGESDLDSLLSHVYQTTIIIHRGVKEYYPTFCVSLLKDSFLYSEKSLLYLLNLMLYLLQRGIELFYDNVMPLFHYLCRQNYELASYIVDYFPQLITSAIKSILVLSVYSQKSVIFIFRFIRKIALYFGRILNHMCKDSTLNSLMKKLWLYLKTCVTHLLSTEASNHIKESLSHLYYISKPCFVKYFQKTFTIVKCLTQTYAPLVKDGIIYALKESVPMLRKFIDDNLEDILNAYNSIKVFLSENSHRMKSISCHACRFFYTSVIYLYNALQAMLPHIIQFSSTVIISLIAFSNFVVDYCLHIVKVIRDHSASVLESHKVLFSCLCRNCMNIFKTAYKLVVEMQPYMVLVFRIFFSELTKLIHVLAPTSLACLQEVNSSLLYASREAVSKSSLAVKRILPSFYFAAKTVVPPTVQAARGIIKTSANSVAVVCPAIFRSVLLIRPELEEGIIVLFMDGNKACLEIISVSFSASCELKNAAKTVSRNLPVCYRAAREVLAATSCAAFEVSVTSLSAKRRMFKDFKRARNVIFTSFLLAEQEIFAVCTDAVFEINAVMANSSQNGSLCDGSTFSSLANYLSKPCKKCLSKMGSLAIFAVNISNSVIENSVICFRDFIKAVVYIHSCIFFFAYSLSCNCLLQKMVQAVCAALFKSSYDIFTATKCVTASQIQHLCVSMCSNLSDINIKIMDSMCTNMSKVWHAFKSCVWTLWSAAVRHAPQVWTMVEHLTSVFWDYLVENVPVVWTVWKKFCSNIWRIINDLAPRVWQYSSTVTPVIWSSIRLIVKNFWYLFIDSSSLMWQHTTFLSSESWMLSNTYLPDVWFAGCAETRKAWKVTCYLIENCWTFTVETCLLSWQILHRSVAKSWRSSLAVTKTAYHMLATSSSILKKSFFICSKSKNRVCVILKATPRMAGKSFHFLKLRNALQLSNATKECDRFDTEAADNPSSTQLRFSADISNRIFAVVNYFPRVDKLLNYETFIPYSKVFRRNPAELPSS